MTSKLTFVPTVPASRWRSFPSQDIPSLFNYAYGHIYYYALESLKTVVTDVDTNAVTDVDTNAHQSDEDDDQGLGHKTAKPLKNGRKYVDSGFVHDMTDTKTEEHYFLRAHVWPSVRNKLPHNVTIILSILSCMGSQSFMLLVIPVKFLHLDVAVMLLLFCFLCSTMSMNMGLPYLNLAPAKNVQGIKAKTETKSSKIIKCAIFFKRKLGSSSEIDFDPRLESFRRVKPCHINGLVNNLQTVSQNSNEISMWETQLEMNYEDYEFKNIDASGLMNKASVILQSLTPPKLDFDPRLESFRRVKPCHINGLVKNLQTISQNSNEILMWETQLEMKYEDYEFKNIDASGLMNRASVILQSLTPPKLQQMEGTENQSCSEIWHSERWCHLTASQRLNACRLGQLVFDKNPSADVRAFKFISSYVWGINREQFQTYWMSYGLESEPKAILKYEDKTKSDVCASGLWVNTKYPFMGCCPDGLVDDDGLIEIKSLKILKMILWRR